MSPRMTARKPRDTAAAYTWDAYPDDPTLGGAITAEMFDALQASIGTTAPPESADDA
jgi:hypothetical protein